MLLEILIPVCLLLLVIVLMIQFIILKKSNASSGQALLISGLQERLQYLDQTLRGELKANREELSLIAKENRQELNALLVLLGEKNEQALQKMNTIIEERIGKLDANMQENNRVNRQELAKNMNDYSVSVKEQMKQMQDQATTEQKNSRESIQIALKQFQDSFDQNIKSFNELQREKFSGLENKQVEMINVSQTQLENIRISVEEKLEKTLSERLGQSFETVGKQLIEVQKGLGEMQTIASDVGGLRKVLSNVKLRGGVGETQLALLLEQILAPVQYDANVITKKGSGNPVEFAIKLPGAEEEENSFVYLPIDAKFPKDTYEKLIEAYENAIPEDIDSASKNLEYTIKKMAKDIRDKYISPPDTTDFAVMFLPFESIYAEVIRRSDLVDQLRNEFKVTVAGPTTLMAILNSLQMGFRTLAIQKRSSEVWRVLAGVKSEFEKFGGMLEKAQKNIQTGLGQLDDMVGTRTRAINRQLKKVESLPAKEGEKLLPDLLSDTFDEEF